MNIFKMRRNFILFITFSLFISHSYAKTDLNTTKKVRTFISNNWGGTIKVTLKDSANLFGLPKPYSVPSVLGETAFKEMYYWDTYFTNLGLLLDHQVNQAQNNTDDIIFMVNRFGKMLNGSNVAFLNRSQPPYLSMMVYDVYHVTNNKIWLKDAVKSLEKEYSFWMKERITPCGLNRYSSAASDDEKRGMAYAVQGRSNNPDLLKGLTDKQILVAGSHFTAEAESGWDFTPRFESRCEDFCPIDLNSNLYVYEKNFEFFYRQLGNDKKAEQWKSIANKRRYLMNKYFYDSKKGCFYDYDYVHKTHSSVLSAAIFSLMYAKAVNNEQAKKIVNALKLLETPFGLRTCEDKNYDRTYQWGSTNGWAPLHFIAAVGLENYKYHAESSRIENKYINMVNNNFLKTNNLWEKYNIIDGTSNAASEYGTPALLGWTAGVYIYFTENRHKN